MKILRSTVVILATVFVAAASAWSQNAGNVDQSFTPGTGPSYPIYSLAVQSNGKIVIGGNFLYLGGYTVNGFARLNPGGSIDFTFNPHNGANAAIYAVAIQPDGKVLIGGAFTEINGYYRSGLARLNTDGSVDTTFGNYDGANGIVHAIAIQPDGQILVGGEFTEFNNNSFSGLARLNGSDGSLDFSFYPGSGASAPVYALALESDGSLIVGGNFLYFNDYYAGGLVRLNSSGTVETNAKGNSILAQANYFINAIQIQPDGKILVGGGFTELGGYLVNAVARLDAGGGVDTGFYDPAGGPNGPVLTLGLQSNGDVVIGGEFTGVDSNNGGSIARLLPSGKLDTAYGPGYPANGAVTTLKVLPSGETVAGGSFTSIGGIDRDFIARLYENATTNPTNAKYIRLLSLDGKDFRANSTVQLTAEASSANDPITSLALYNNTTLVSKVAVNAADLLARTIKSSPTRQDAAFQQSFANLIASLASGLNNLKVVGTTQSGATLTSNTAGITGQDANVTASCQITSPASGPVPAAGTPVQVTVQKAAQPVTVEFYVDSAIGAASQVQPGDQSTSTFMLPALSTDRAHYLTAVVTDNATGISSQSAQIVLNPATAVSPSVVSVVIPGVSGSMTTISDHGPKLKLLITRSGTNLDVSQPLTVNYKAKGSAEASVNYKALSGSVTIPAGAASVKLKVKPLDAGDSTVLKLKLLPSATGSYSVGTPVTKVHIENE